MGEEMRRGRWPLTFIVVFWWSLFLLWLIFLSGCSHAKPQLPNPPSDPGTATIVWRGDDQVEVGWTGMPVTVRGGSEDSVLRLQATAYLPEPREVESVESFMGFDRGDAVEADIQVYNDQNEVVYRRSLHLEGGVPECYDAFAHADALVGDSTRYLVFHATCRVNGVNGNPEHPRYGDLSARCHFLTTVTFR